MVLVDTSVWIRYLADRAPWADEMDRLLEQGEVLAHDLVYGELLIGDKGGRRRLLEDYAKMRKANGVSHGDAVAFVRHRRLHGQGVGWIDIHLLASALVDRVPLWTADERFSRIAEDLGVGYAMRATTRAN